jgi:hypothetical protein
MSDQQTPRADNEFMPKARALFNMTLCGCITPRQQHEGDIVNLFEVTDRPALVRPGLFIGSWDSESDQELLQQLGITHVLQVRPGKRHMALHCRPVQLMLLARRCISRSISRAYQLHRVTNALAIRFVTM